MQLVLVSYLRLRPEAFGIDALSPTVNSARSPPLSRQARRTRPQVGDAIVAAGGRAEVTEADLTDPDQVTGLFDWAEHSVGPVEILVDNAAASQDPDSSFTSTFETYRNTFDVNAGATILMTAESVGRCQVNG